MHTSKNSTISSHTNAAGFTLVELMIALVVSGLVMAAVVSVYIAQTRSYGEHDDVADIQQNLRGALAILTTEIRMAGYDPTRGNVATILTTTPTRLRFTRDITGDGDVDDPNEDIEYQLVGTSLGRQTAGAGGFQPLADNIEALEFHYILDDGTMFANPTPGSVRAVKISLLARASNPAQNFRHAGSYTSASGNIWNPPQDNFRRRLVTTTIFCRNMEYK